MMDKGFMTAVIKDNGYVFSLLEELSTLLQETDDRKPNAQNTTIREFFDTWRDKNAIPEFYQINTFTNLVRLIFAGIAIPQNAWSDKIDNIYLSDLDSEWGIEESDCYTSNGEKISLETCIKRLRNAIAHSRVEIIVPDGYSASDLLYEETKVVFTDVNMRNSGDIFKATLSAKKVITLINKLSQLSEQSYIEEWKKEVKGR